MVWTPLKLFPKKCLGIDIGTSHIRVVELNKFGNKLKLQNYGEVKAMALYKKSDSSAAKTSLQLSSNDISRALWAILKESRIKTKKAVFSIPDFATFFTWFTLPPMTKEEVPLAIRYEAQQHIPLPISEVTLDWQITSGKISETEKNTLKILLVAVPKEVLSQYEEIIAPAPLELRAVEAEVFALSRALTREEEKLVVLLDIGAQTTTISIVDKRILKRSHTMDIAGNELTNVVSKSLNIDYNRAETLKENYGLNPISRFLEPDVPYGQDLRSILEPLIDAILIEVEKISQEFYEAESKEIKKIILSGGSALMPGLKEYFFEKLGKETDLANPFSALFCPPILEKTLKIMGPSYAIAVGAALRGLE